MSTSKNEKCKIQQSNNPTIQQSNNSTIQQPYKKLFTLLVLFCLTATGLRSKADVNFVTNGQITSCYQDVLLGSGSQINLLNIGGTTSFRFDETTSATLYTEYVRIQISDGNGGYIDLLDAGGGLTLEDINFQWTSFPTDVFPIIPFKTVDGNIINTNSFTFGNVTSAKLTLYDGFGAQHVLQEIDLNFFSTLDEAFTFEPENSSCFKYDPFNLRASTFLDGLCGTSDLKLEPLASNPLASQLASSYDLDFPWEFGLFKSIPVSSNINVGDHCDNCLAIAAPYYVPNPVTCGCTSFSLTFTLMPCDGVTLECPPLEMSKEIEICCSCDIRATPPAH
jgi:hypothetical protein